MTPLLESLTQNAVTLRFSGKWTLHPHRLPWQDVSCAKLIIKGLISDLWCLFGLYLHGFVTGFAWETHENLFKLLSKILIQVMGVMNDSNASWNHCGTSKAQQNYCRTSKSLAEPSWNLTIPWKTITEPHRTSTEPARSLVGPWQNLIKPHFILVTVMCWTIQKIPFLIFYPFILYIFYTI